MVAKKPPPSSSAFIQPPAMAMFPRAMWLVEGLSQVNDAASVHVYGVWHGLDGVLGVLSLGRGT